MNPLGSRRGAKLLGGAALVAGSGLFTHGFFSFAFRSLTSSSSIAYFYSPDAILNMTIGVMLVVFGVLLTKTSND